MYFFAKFSKGLTLTGVGVSPVNPVGQCLPGCPTWVQFLQSYTKPIPKIICNVYRSLNHSNYPVSLKELLNLRQTKYSLRGKYILQIPKANTTTYGLKSWRYQAAKLWNSLPDTVRAAENYGMFSNSVSLNDLKILDDL